jgi:hypothetical protein
MASPAAVALAAFVSSLLLRCSGVRLNAARGSTSSAGNATAIAGAAGKFAATGVDVEVIQRESMSAGMVTDCLCPMGSFWHWRIEQCVEQGGWGYECGFFPAEHHHRVCKDGLVCKSVHPPTKDVYYSYGKFMDTANSYPASCQTCSAEDKCKTGKARHNQECLTRATVSGEATVRVRVTVTRRATANATATHTHNGHTATADHTAIVEAQTSVEASATVTVEEAKALAGVGSGDMSATEAATVVSTGDELAYSRATSEAEEKARQKGLLEAKHLAKQTAEAEAAEKAKMKAKALEREAKAWEAEAGTNAGAQDAAKSHEKELDKAAANATAEATEHEKAKAEADLDGS